MVVFVAQIPDRDALETIALRLKSKIMRVAEQQAVALRFNIGIAMNPLDGYCAADLIRSASKMIVANKRRTIEYKTRIGRRAALGAHHSRQRLSPPELPTI